MTSMGWKRGLVAAGALLLGLALTGGAWAQNMFYREVAKDGRIYVFAIGSRYDGFEKSGGAEIGVAITRLGYGPNQETVIFDSEDAINLYNFKHNLPGEVFAKPKEAPKPREESFFKVGVTIFADYTYQDEPKVTDADKNSINASSFELRRAYINVTGNISDWVSYRVTPDISGRFATTTTATALPTDAAVSASTNYDGSLVYRLKYAFGQVNLDKVTTHGTWVRFGQQQTPFVDFMEGIYRYRFQGTIFEEREGFLSSSDVGLSGRYVFPNDYGDVHLGYYNGDTYSRAEANDRKAFQIRGTLRPLPKMGAAKGIRLTVFYDADKPIQGGKRDRLIVAGTFEHKYLNLGLDYLDAKDQSSPTKAEVKANGWTIWAEPRSPSGFEGLLRYDHFKPNKDVNAVKTRFLGGLSYWLKVKAPLAVAVLVDYEQVKYDTLLARPTEKRFEIKTLFNF
jgi:Phosphate-selective porin O and P